MAHPVVLFDGVCNLCNGSVQWIIARDPAAFFHFAPLQSDAARRLLAEVGRAAPVGDPETILLVEHGRVFERSTAALRIARRLRGPARWLAAFLIVPAPIRDACYRFIARHRYRWFGRREECRLPTPELSSRFEG